ncbi:MAG: toxin Cry1Ac domain D-VI-related protein [Coprobacillaceae bacterium]
MKINKISKLFLTSALVMGTFFTISSTTLEKVSAETDATNAPNDWAFTEDSIPLHDAILNKYPTIDQAPNGNDDGYISIIEAASWSGNIIDVRLQSLMGTITGVENFTNITYLLLGHNSFSGKIPEEIGNISTLMYLQLQQNLLTGEIPSSLGGLNNLVDLYLHDNQLTGSIPKELGNLYNLKILSLYNNQLSGTIPAELGNLGNLTKLTIGGNNISGSIPEELGNLHNLKELYIQDNELSGDFPQSIYNLPNLTNVRVQGNEDLSGNPAEGFENSNTLVELNVSGTGLVQAKPDSSSLVNFVGDDLAEALLNSDRTGPADGLSQEEIDRAQETADWISDLTEKQQWQNNIDLAQSMLDAQDNVVALLNDTKTDIKDTTTQGLIDNAKDVAANLPDGQFKTDLLADIDLAQDFLSNRITAKDKVDNLFTDSTHVDIKNTTDQTAINDALTAVNSLPDGTFKNELFAEVAKAQDMLNAKEAVDNLFKEDGIIKDSIIQEDIYYAQDLVNKIPDGDLKNELQNKLDEAQKQYDEKYFIILEEFEMFKGLGTVHTKIDAPVEKFSKVYVDTKELDVSNYVVTNGSTVITLNEDYLKTLANGIYDVDIEFTSGAKVRATLLVNVESSTPLKAPTISKPTTGTASTLGGTTVNTSDITNITIPMALLALSLFTILVITIKKPTLNRQKNKL